MADSSTSKLPPNVRQIREPGEGSVISTPYGAVEDPVFKPTVGTDSRRARDSNPSSIQSKSPWAPLWIALAIVGAGGTMIHGPWR